MIVIFLKNLEKEISDRDLSEDKIKNASILGLKLPNFKGYNSVMDFYTFKAVFEKLVAPRVQAKLLPEYLKNNYLEGQAFEIVKEIDDIDKIWGRLKLSFGNVVILLSTKLKEIESGVPLWQIKDDEKLVQAITKIKNCMMELSSLAAKHKIEASLFHHSNLAKIYNILGRRRQTDITKKLIKFDYNEQETWSEIIKILETELRVKEQILLFEHSHSKKSENSKSVREKDRNQTYNVNQSKRNCVICEKNDHVPTITKRGNLIVNYFACDKFAKMSPKERFEELKRKNLCFQCLTPGLKAKHEGNCFDKFKCPNESHKQHKFGLHVLICDRHKNNKENLELLELYKAKCITGSGNAGTPYPDFSKNINFLSCGNL